MLNNKVDRITPKLSESFEMFPKVSETLILRENGYNKQNEKAYFHGRVLLRIPNPALKFSEMPVLRCTFRWCTRRRKFKQRARFILSIFMIVRLAISVEDFLRPFANETLEVKFAENPPPGTTIFASNIQIG